MRDWVEHALDTTLCISAAGVLTIVLRGSMLKGFLPFLFLGVVILIALRFGTAAGILGTVSSALIFAEFLFDPLLSIRIGDLVQRNNLIWMVIGGITMSELLGVNPKTPTHGADPKGTSGI